MYNNMLILRCKHKEQHLALAHVYPIYYAVDKLAAFFVEKIRCN